MSSEPEDWLEPEERRKEQPRYQTLLAQFPVSLDVEIRMLVTVPESRLSPSRTHANLTVSEYEILGEMVELMKATAVDAVSERSHEH